MFDYGWDKEFGGIYYFMDRKGFPPQQLEWDQKLWWVHIETLIAMIKGYQLTKDSRCLEVFEKYINTPGVILKTLNTLNGSVT